MVVAATSPLATIGVELRIMFGASTTLQNESGGDSAGALSRVFFGGVGPTQVRPYIVITLGDEHGYGLIGGGEQNQLRAQGRLYVVMVRSIKSAHLNDNNDAQIDAANFFDGINADCAELAALDDGTNVHPSLVEIQVQPGTFGEMPDEYTGELGRAYAMGVTFEWGDSTKARF